MAVHPDFPESPYEILEPEVRWYPDSHMMDTVTVDKLMPPLVAELRRRVKEFRDSGYAGASETSKSLLNWWFNTPHLIDGLDGQESEFEYYFAQREALETIIYLYDAARVKDKYDLMRYDSSGILTASMFDENWRRFVVKMATGSGKTKVLALVLTWCYFHKLYEPDSDLARNFLVITPNIIVLDRIYKDFKGLKIFFEDPVLPDNGFDGRDWQNDFQLTLHLQDEVKITHKTGNIFLTNIHRVYAGNDLIPSLEDEDLRDYFLGSRPVARTMDSTIDLGMIVRDIDELVILNDEAHHIHDPRMAWFKSIDDIHNRLKQKGGALALQIDVTATPKHNNGAIFVQTVSDYPLVEAIKQNVVKHPVLPDPPSQAKLEEKQSIHYTERFADYINLGVIEWRKAYAEHEKVGKKAILFVMTDDTRNCDEVADYLRSSVEELQDATLVIHTKNNGEISEASSGKAKEVLDELRVQANSIDEVDSPWKAIVSVMMLKEGWDVRNVTTIVGLRPYVAQSNILPEQTLGRGLRKMYGRGIEEYVSVVGTKAFIEFVESIQQEGVMLDHRPMGEGTGAKAPLVIEVDYENVRKDIEALDIQVPVLSPRIYREYGNLAKLDVTKLEFQKIMYLEFSPEEQREIVFKDITEDEINHTTILDTTGLIDYRGVIAYFAKVILREKRLVSGYDVLYGKIKEFIQYGLFGQPVELENLNTLRNLSELSVTRTILETFFKAINTLTVQDKGDAEVRELMRIRNTRPFVAREQGYLVPKKSVFNRIIGDSHFELEFASFLDECPDVVSFAKNYLAVHFRLDYVNAKGDISNYYPDFFVKVSERKVFVVETKGEEDLDDPLKLQRLKQWCEDVNRVQHELEFDFLYVDQENFERYRPTNFGQLEGLFLEFKTEEQR